MIKETMSFSDEFKSPILSSACGFDVTLTVTGTIRVLTFPARPVGPDDLSTGNVAVVATNTANGKQVRWEQGGLTVDRVEPDGTVITMIAGHRPVEVTGVMKINFETGETIMQSHDVDEIPKICARLTG